MKIRVHIVAILKCVVILNGINYARGDKNFPDPD
ncbi:MAG: hypothetical protein RBG13Loki_2779 [Promethearchaeota archaeon CR_4]|nr:MAG: hypothetical protein RBG13Loki_2779 [Candidatus Lokiarchaeota archaeon CR_4]